MALERQAFLVAAIDIEDHIGQVDEALAFEVAGLPGLAGPTIRTPDRFGTRASPERIFGAMKRDDR